MSSFLSVPSIPYVWTCERRQRWFYFSTPTVCVCPRDGIYSFRIDCDVNGRNIWCLWWTCRWQLNCILTEYEHFKLYIFFFDSFQLYLIPFFGASTGIRSASVSNIWQMQRILKQFTVGNLIQKIHSHERERASVCFVCFFVGVPVGPPWSFDKRKRMWWTFAAVFFFLPSCT